MNTQNFYQNPNPEQKPVAENDSSTSPDTKERSIRALAVVGFIGLIVLIAILIINLVSFIPNIVSSVASVINTQTENTLQVQVTEDSIESGEMTFLSWESTGKISSYAFAFSCSNYDLRTEVRTNEYGTQTITCDTTYTLDEIKELSLTIFAEEARFNTLNYTIYGYIDGEDTDPVTAEGSIEILNRNISIGGSNTDEEKVETEPEENTEEEIEDDTTSEPETPRYTYREEYVYDIPKSDPNGYTELALTYKGVGTLTSNHTFVPAGSFSTEETGAIKFSVKNTGTKTSDSWTYSTKLPNGTKYTSKTQTPLKPNEEATIILGFRAPSKADTYPFSVSIKTARDSNSNNNSFSWSVTTTR